MGSKKGAQKPTKMQTKTFRILKENPGMGMNRAMKEAGYTPSSIANMRTRHGKGFKKLEEKYKRLLMRKGVSLEKLAEIQAEGLKDKDPRVKMDYLKETKKDFGFKPDNNDSNIQVNVFSPILNKDDIIQ